jgi:hypothetical protein
MTLGQAIALFLAVFLVAWYISGTLINLRRRERAQHWLREGMESLGMAPEARWFATPSAGARLTAARLVEPFHYFEVRFLLEPREAMPYWLITWLQGRRDEIIIGAILTREPQAELLAARPEDRRFSPALKLKGQENFIQLDAAPQFVVMARGSQSAPLLRKFTGLLNRYPQVIFRAAAQKQEPHLLVRARLDEALRLPPGEFFAALARVF